jgi:hypothetical protein
LKGFWSSSLSLKYNFKATCQGAQLETVIIPAPTDKISKYFTWKDALWLPTWNRMTRSEEINHSVIDNLIITFHKADDIREFFNLPMNIHCAYRPTAYNSLPSIKGAPNSGHVTGMAIDYDINGIVCDVARDRLIAANFLELNGLRMEKRPGSNWVHNDWKGVPPGGNRYFNV